MKRFTYLLPLLFICVAFAGCSTKADYDIKSTIAGISITVISMLFLVLAINSNILRDEITDIDAFNSNAQALQKQNKWRLPKSNAPFSLTKVQFGLWTVIISSVYIYLSLFKGDCAVDGINKTALVLMGIFAGTAVASTMIDKNELNDNRPRYQNKPSQGFFIDILSDGDGISLHRFQNFTWTVIAMIIYLYKVSEVQTGCQLPELSDTLLALTGISSATYLVLKTKENNPAAVNTLVTNDASVNTASTATTQPAVG